MLKAFAFRCTISGASTRVIELDAAAEAEATNSVTHGSAWARSPFRFGFADGQSTFEVEQEIAMDVEEVVVTTVAESFLRQTDRQYVRSIYGPVHGMIFWFKGPEEHVVQECHGSPEDLRWEPGRSGAFGSARATGRKAEVTANGWVLPGIAGVVIWKPACGPPILRPQSDNQRP